MYCITFLSHGSTENEFLKEPNLANKLIVLKYKNNLYEERVYWSNME